MGEAKRRGKLKDRLLGAGASCVFCGGIEPATTVDHVPPKAIFAGRFRPPGLEFAACQGCNDGSRPTDQVVGWLSRIFPDPPHAARSEVVAIMRAIKNNHPDLLIEMAPVPEHHAELEAIRASVPPGTEALYAGGPILTGHMNRFAAKLGLALHFAQTGRIVPSSGAVAVRWFSNLDAMTGVKPDTSILGSPQTLRQGGIEVSGQFRYASTASQDGHLSSHAAVFREAFAVTTTVVNDSRLLDTVPPKNVFRPGFLQKDRL